MNFIIILLEKNGLCKSVTVRKLKEYKFNSKHTSFCNQKIKYMKQ